MITPFYQEYSTTVFCGDARQVLAELPEHSVDMVCCSPPYFGLRSYKCEPSIWACPERSRRDGDENCKHEWQAEETKHDNLRYRGETSEVGNNRNPAIHPGVKVESQFCLKCRAWRGVLGMEPTPGLYIQHLVGIFDLVRRVLKPTGTCFVNLGDSYAGSGKASGQSIDDVSDKQATNFASAGLKQGNIGIPAKSLIGIPARFQLAMIEHGWICRNEIVWWKRCLTGNTSIFAKSNGIPVRTSVRELYRLKKNSLELPNENGGWVKLTSIEQIGKKQVIRIILRNGFWITCTPEHRFKVNGELIESRNER